jgi:hypothetical protein
MPKGKKSFLFHRSPAGFNPARVKEYIQQVMNMPKIPSSSCVVPVGKNQTHWGKIGLDFLDTYQ